jgi:hypothetical protein
LPTVSGRSQCGGPSRPHQARTEALKGIEPREAHPPGDTAPIASTARRTGVNELMTRFDPLPVAAKLRLEHGALAALLVPTPTPAIIAALRTVRAAHNGLEEGPRGVYDMCEQLAGAEVDALLARLQAAPEVPVAPYSDGPQVMSVVR